MEPGNLVEMAGNLRHTPVSPVVLGHVLGVVLVAAIFAIVHFQPVETPGLFVVGLVLGTCALRTRRLGMGVLAHMAFNATGLVLVAVK